VKISELLEKQKAAILDGETDKAVELARQAILQDVNLSDCIDKGYIAGIREVGRLWAEGEYFLPELVQGADAMKAALAILRPELLKGMAVPGDESRVLLGTVQGDIHDIGKSLVGTILEANGFSVIDLGRDVPDELFIEKIRSDDGIRVVGLSALLTTTMVHQGRVIDRLEKEGLRRKVTVLVGGAPVNRSFAEKIGADGYAPNAMQALELVRRVVGGKDTSAAGSTARRLK
jgi:corrinoid protein of di/trimethylamine methyltransferase